jgi:Raf kinase inhibitor-like YbhB/YbcL family protein
MHHPIATLGLFAMVATSACARAPAAEEATPMSQLKIESSAFAEGETIPTKYTCEGDDVSPPLQWSNVPAGTKSLALIVDDPDAPDPKAPKRTWVHWVLYEIPADATSLPEGASPLPAGTRDGINDWDRTGYGGPCPPIGRHRYFFKLYALDAALGDLSEPTKAELEQAMTGHVLAQTELIGTYKKKHE